MVNVDILTNAKDDIIGFEIKGHAGYDKYGNDLVCSAVTILAYTCVNTLDKYLENIEFEDDGDIMRLIAPIINDDSQIIFDYFNTGIETLLGNYSSYVRLNYKEKS